MSDQPLRPDLSFRYSRRNFWRALLREALVVSGVLKGGQGYSLAELSDLPDDQLAHIRPIVHPDCEIYVEDGLFWGRCQGRGDPIQLFPVADTARLIAVNLFNGQHTLGEIGARIAQEMGWDEDAAFAQARELFLSLVSLLICLPRDPLDAVE